MKYNLPKQYLSYSQLDLWQKNKDQYRARYYLNGPSFENTETIFGKKIASFLERLSAKKEWGERELKKIGVTRDEYLYLKKVKKFKYSEYRIEIEVGGVPFLGVMDTFSKHFRRIGEFKTGKEPWNDVRVRKHQQLVVYSLLVKSKFRKVDPWVKLIWLQTEYKPVMDTIGSITCERESNELSFTGLKPQIFKRRIAEWERKKMKETIQRVAQEISDDFTQFQIYER